MARSARRTPAQDPTAELVELARDLDLTTVAAILPQVLDQAAKEAASYSSFAHLLLAAESKARWERRLERSLRRSHLGSVEGLDGFDFSIRPQLHERVVRQLLDGAWARDKRNILCLGKPGLGKTRVAKSLVHAACLAGFSTLSTTAVDMIEDLHASHADGTFRRALRRYVKPGVLLVDEFGLAGGFDAEATSYLFRVISARHKQGAIVITANVGFSKWKTLFPSEAHAVAAVDRLVDGATILRFSGKTRRGPQEVVGAPLEDD